MSQCIFTAKNIQHVLSKLTPSRVSLQLANVCGLTDADLHASGAFGARASAEIEEDEDIAVHATSQSAIKQRTHLQLSSTKRDEMRTAVRLCMEMMDGIAEKLSTTPGYAASKVARTWYECALLHEMKRLT